MAEMWSVTTPAQDPDRFRSAAEIAVFMGKKTGADGRRSFLRFDNSTPIGADTKDEVADVSSNRARTSRCPTAPCWPNGFQKIRMPFRGRVAWPLSERDRHLVMNGRDCGSRYRAIVALSACARSTEATQSLRLLLMLDYLE
jgi:hypothetical protein